VIFSLALCVLLMTAEISVRADEDDDTETGWFADLCVLTSYCQDWGRGMLRLRSGYSTGIRCHGLRLPSGSVYQASLTTAVCVYTVWPKIAHVRPCFKIKPTLTIRPWLRSP